MIEGEEGEKWLTYVRYESRLTDSWITEEENGYH